MTSNGFEERPGRETRLLVLVVVVALAVLLLLARFRFPSSNLSVVPPLPSPLDRLASRSMFDEMGATLAAMVQRVSPSIVIVPVEPVDAPKSGEVPKPGSVPVSVEPPTRPAMVAAIRVRPGLAVLMLPAGTRVAPSTAAADEMIEVLAADGSRGLTLLRVKPTDDVRGSLPDLVDGFAGFSYVAAVEAVPGGPSARPVFVGRVEAVTDDRWFSPPLLLGGVTDVQPGTLVFALDGRFIGLAWRHEDGLALILPSAIDAVVADLLRPSGRADR
jgi:hypothetical protein